MRRYPFVVCVESGSARLLSLTLHPAPRPLAYLEQNLSSVSGLLSHCARSHVVQIGAFLTGRFKGICS